MSWQAQGAALLAAGRHGEALTAFGHALKAEPTALDARLGLAQACLALGDAWTAIAWLSDACRIAPDQGEPAQKLAELLMAQKQYGQALPVYERLYAQGARDRVTLLHSGFCHEHTGALTAAVARYREAIAAEPDFLEAHVDLAGVLWRLGDYEGALAHARRAVQIAPDHVYAVRILGTALLHLNRLPEAEAQLRRALALQPGFALAMLDLALLLLLDGRLAEGWVLYRERWSDSTRMRRPVFYNPALEWQGPQLQPPAGLRIVVYAEQGLGDVIQFIRYAKLLQRDGATVYAVVQPELVPLVESMPGVVCHKPEVTLQADCHVALLDLPMHYGTTLANVPAEVPYLGAPAARVAAWRDRLKPWDGVLKVGIAWAGQAVQVNHLNRSMPLSEFQPLLHLPGVQCFSLQKSDGAAFTDIVPSAGSLVDFTAEWADFSDSAAMLENLDLVITIDTATAHLAGALGRPVWLLPPPNPDWRWLLARDDCPWYPSMRLFRRGFDETRAQQVARVVEAVRARLST